MPLSKQQKDLLRIIKTAPRNLEYITKKYKAKHPEVRFPKRKAGVASWLYKLKAKGLVDTDFENGVAFKATDKAIEALKLDKRKK